MQSSIELSRGTHQEAEEIRYPWLCTVAILRSLTTASEQGTGNSALRSLYHLTAHQQLDRIQNDEEQLIDDFLQILSETNSPHEHVTYWNHHPYQAQEIVGVLAQFFDDHAVKLPTEMLPPSKDLSEFIEAVLSANRRLSVAEQFEILLNICHDDILGAALVGCLASRIMARNADTRAYPNIHVTSEQMFEWERKVAQFPHTPDSLASDAAGDTYYFWTHFFAAVVFSQLPPSLMHSLSQSFFTVATPIMLFTRRYIAHKPTTSEHHSASLLGRNLGLAVADTLQ